MDDTGDIYSQLLQQAVEDAREKAEITAAAAGRKLGKVITVSESGVVSPMYYRGMEAMGGDVASAPIEPGTQTSYKNVTVIFELR